MPALHAKSPSLVRPIHARRRICAILWLGLLLPAIAGADTAPVITRQPEGGAKVAGMQTNLTVEATGTAPLSYEWRKDGIVIGGLNQPALLLANLTPALAGSYTVTVANGAGSVTSDPAVITVSTAPVLNHTTLGPAVTAGTPGFTDVRFEIYAYGANLQFEWSYPRNASVENGLDASGQGFYSILTIHNARYEDQGSVTARVHNAEGSLQLPVSTLTVMGQTAAPPTITRDLANQTAHIGQRADLSVTAAGTYPMAYQWYKDGAPIGGGTESAFQAGRDTTYTLTLPALQTGDAGAYKVTLTNPFGSVTSATMTLATTLPPLAITTDLADKTGVLGQPVTLTLVAEGVGNLSYQWYKDGIAIPGATGASHTIATLQPGDAGNYTAVVSNQQVTVTSRVATLSYSVPATVATQVAYVGNLVVLLPPDLPAGEIRWQVSTDSGTTWSVLADGATYAGTATPALEILHAAQGMNGYLYRYQYTSGGKTSTSPATTLLVLPTVLTMPIGLAVDETGVIYVADAAAQTVLKVGNDGQPSLLAGGIGLAGSADGIGTAARFNEPTGLVLTDDRSVLVADANNSTLRKISPDGTVTTFAGQAGATGSTEGAGTAVRFNTPTGLARDAAGNLYVADQMNHLLRILSPVAASGTMAGKPGLAGAVDSVGPAAMFNRPTGVASDAAGNLYVADQGNHLIRRVTPAGQVSTIAGLAGQSGSADGPAAQARFNRPGGIAVAASGDVFVADTGNSTIRRISGGVVSTIAGHAAGTGLMDGRGAHAWFQEPEGLAFDPAGNLLVADTGNFALRRITPAGDVTTLSIGWRTPTITAQPTNVTVGVGATVLFSVTATSDTAMTYQWRKNGNPIPGSTGTSHSITAVTAGDAGNYSVVVTNAHGSTTSSTATLTVTQPSTPPPAQGGGGGGSVSPAFLGALALLAGCRRLFAGRARPTASHPDQG